MIGFFLQWQQLVYVVGLESGVMYSGKIEQGALVYSLGDRWFYSFKLQIDEEPG